MLTIKKPLSEAIELRSKKYSYNTVKQHTDRGFQQLILFKLIF